MTKKKPVKKMKAKGTRTTQAKKVTRHPVRKKSSLSATQSRNSQDIIQLILADHRPLKRLIEKMKNTVMGHKERHKAFHQFAPLLLQHAQPEEQVLYARMKQDDNTRTLGFEGDVEHSLASQLIEEAANTEDEDLFCARIKVLAELVEHHVEEEETELLPEFRDNSEAEERRQMGGEYLLLKAKFASEASTDLRPKRQVDHPEKRPEVSFKTAI